MKQRGLGCQVIGLARVRMRDLESVIAAACSAHRITVDEFYSKGRYMPLPEARATASVAFRELGFSLAEIGRLIERDHTTVLAHLQRRKAVA